MGFLKKHRGWSVGVFFTLDAVATCVIAALFKMSGIEHYATWATLCSEAVTVTLGIVLMMAAKPKAFMREGRNVAVTVALAVGMLLVVWLAGTLGATWVQTATGDVLYERYAETAADMGIVYVICATVLAPIAEECLFRGGIFGQLAHTRMPLIASAFISSGLFALAHMTLAHLVPTLLLGLLLCWAYAKTGNIAVTVTMHMAYNVISQLAVGLNVPDVLATAGVAGLLCLMVVVVETCMLAESEKLHVPDEQRAEIQGL